MMKVDYKVVVLLKNGSEKVGFKFNRSQVKELQLIPLDEGLKKITLALDSEKKLIFYVRRVFETRTGKYEKSIYFLGYEYANRKFLLSVDSITGEIKIEDDKLR